VAGAQQVVEAVMQKIVQTRVSGAETAYPGTPVNIFLIKLGAGPAVAAERSIEEVKFSGIGHAVKAYSTSLASGTVH
jgi:hypothetical protein